MLRLRGVSLLEQSDTVAGRGVGFLEQSDTFAGRGVRYSFENRKYGS